jgi:peptide/nickel transport system substrate-binding protein
MRHFVSACVAGAALLGSGAILGPARGENYIEAPSLAGDVAAGKLPPLEARLPANPLVIGANQPDLVPGQYGGELRMIFGRPQDVRMLSVYGYARLVGYDRTYTLVPDLLARVEVTDQRIFTLHLRPGHRWSDGEPFTSEAFRYWWEDVANNKRTSPLGPPKVLQVDAKPPKVEIVDPVTVRYSWDGPNPYFLPALAGPSPLFIYLPGHYLRQFHERYADKAKLDEAIKKAGVRNWAQLHNRLDKLDRNDNPDLPTLDPWVVQTRPPAERFIFARNPYFHRVDPQGRQLPYIDRMIVSLADGRIIPTKTGAGESDLQARSLSFSNYTFLRQAAKRNDFSVRLWNAAKGAHLALYPNLHVSDPAWRALNRDVRFRRALSLAVDRHEINQVVYFGLAIEGANTVLPGSPLYRPEYRSAAARLDFKAANQLLDEIGLTRRDGRGVRLLPDGRPLEVIVETAGEDTEQTDVLELIHDSWLRAGVKLFSKPSQRQMFRNRIFSGETMMSIWTGLENGLPTAQFSPEELAPTSQQQLQWPKWGQYAETSGASGELIDDPAAAELLKLNDAWRLSQSDAERTAIWRRMLAIHAEQVYTIGLVAGVKQPVVVSNYLRNIPAQGVYNWDPGAFFGIYHPDMFWFEDPRRAATVR